MLTIPLSKQSKKAQCEYHAKQRGSWHGLNPITRIREKQSRRKLSVLSDG